MRSAVASKFTSKAVRSVVFLGLAFAVWKVVPVYASALRFHLALSEACKTAATGNHGYEDIRKDILFKARQLDLPIRPHQIELQVRPRLVSAIVAYQVPIELGPRPKLTSATAERGRSPIRTRTCCIWTCPAARPAQRASALASRRTVHMKCRSAIQA